MTMDDGAPTRKAELRTRMKQNLARLSPEQRAEWSAAIRRRVEELPAFVESTHVLCCLSFGEEVDTWPLVDALVADPHKTVWTPRCSPGNALLTAHPYPCRLQTLSFGLRQPAAETPVVPLAELRRRLDCVCVLGLAFDPVTRYRLGRGRGHFDRFLAACPATTIALAYECQLVPGLPHDDWDLPMDYLVTERAVYAER